MGLLEPRLSFALVVFVLSPDGEIETVGGEIVSARDLGLSPGGAAAGEVGSALLRGTPWEPARGVTAARLRPLMPRVGRRGEMVLPLWTSGRWPVEGMWEMTSRYGVPLHARALERLAAQLGDPTLVGEAHAEFRRALASDPLSHQMVGEGVRLRGLAIDGLEEIRAREEAYREGLGSAHSDPRPPLPPLLALLPAEFTIEQLRATVRRVARIDEEELESASNFRRRIAEFVDARVLVEVGDVEDAKQKGRPAKLYRFDAERWHAWLVGKVGQLSARELFQARRMRAGGDEHALYASRVAPRPMPEEGNVPPEPPHARMRAMMEFGELPSPSAEARFAAQPKRKPASPEGLGSSLRSASRSATPSAPRTATPPVTPPLPSAGPDDARGPSVDNDQRVARLEEMVKHLLRRFDAMSPNPTNLPPEPPPAVKDAGGDAVRDAVRNAMADLKHPDARPD